MTKLKSCSHCGEEGVVYGNPQFFFVACRACFHQTMPHRHESYAIAEWNRRGRNE